ncbi:hypothetical protein [Roseovarius sp.]|uniref:hypothetical protein n=1 Tax=Roseovarius sp. TaxID=1486281 RepID=UPI002623A34A|nr:hypothetical protein [Roseovarius sp.]MDM8167011.1 hypothetical protein [Roseovarius sp.]
MKKVANKEAADAVKDMHRGLHIAMDHLLNRNDPQKAEEVLRELDFHMANWLNQTKIEK